MFLFRFRYLIHVLTYAAAFAISWSTTRSSGTDRVWLSLPGVLSSYLHVDLHVAIVAVTAAATLLALFAALLRTWATAYLGSRVVSDASLVGTRIVMDGPFRRVRNPLYLGMMLHTLALSVLLTVPAAIFMVVAIIAFEIALTASEEGFLRKALGSAYVIYSQRVPRFFPLPGKSVPAAGAPAHWGQAFVGEIFFWGVAASFLAFGSTYNATLIQQGLLVSLGLSIVVRGLLGTRQSPPAS